MEQPDLTVAVVPATSVAGLYIAQQRGYFTQAGLHVKIVPVASGVNALKGLAVLTSTVLNSHGVDPSSVHFVVIPFPAMGAALAAHRVDAAFMTEPFLSAAENAQGVVPLFDIDQGAAQDFPIAGYVTTQAWAARYPNTRGAFAAALNRGQQLAATSRPAVEQAMIQALHISRQTAAVMALGTYPLVMTGNDLIRVATLMNLNGLLPPKVNATALAKEMITGGH